MIMLEKFISRERREKQFKEKIIKCIEKDNPGEIAGLIIDEYSGGHPDSPKLKRGFLLFLESLREYGETKNFSEDDLPETFNQINENKEMNQRERFVHRWKEAVRMQFPVAEELFDEAYTEVFGDTE